MRNASVPASRRRPILLIIDDYSAFSDMVPLHNLMERLRGTGVAVVAIAHGMESLGTEREAKRLLTSAGTVILHACSLPKELIAVAGTRRLPDFVYHMPQDDTADNQGSVLDQSAHMTIHMREQSSIDPNDVQQLGKGESFWTCGGLHQRVQVEMVPVAKALIEERKEQLLLLDQQAREQFAAQQAAKLALPAATTKAEIPRKQKQQKPGEAPPTVPAPRILQPAQAATAPVGDAQNVKTTERFDVQATPEASPPQTPAQNGDQSSQSGQTPGAGQASTPPAKPKKLDDLL